MAIFHCHISAISRSSGRSSVAASAYRSGEKLTNERDGVTHDYTRKEWQVAYSEVMLPGDLAEKRPELQDRYFLWNEVEESEKRIDSQTAREIEVALPSEFTREEQIEVVRKYVQDNFVKEGMCADINIHDKGDGNPHAHIMLTTRNIDYNTGIFGMKNREWNDKRNADIWRQAWACEVNKKFYDLGMKERIDHRSYEEQGIDKIPTVHLGMCAKMEKRGIQTDRGDYNRDIKAKHSEIQDINNKIKALIREKEQLEKSETANIKTEVPRSGSDIRIEKANGITPDISPEGFAFKTYDKHLHLLKLRETKEMNVLEVEQATEKLQAIQDRVNTLQKRIEEYKGYYDDYQARIEFIREERSTVPASDFRKVIDIGRNIENLEKAKVMLRDKIIQLAGNIQGDNSSIEKINQYISSKQQKIEETDNNISHIQLEFKNLEKAFNNAPEEYRTKANAELNKLRKNEKTEKPKSLEEKVAEIREGQKDLDELMKEQEVTKAIKRVKSKGEIEI